jgi:hypothetical protein
MAADDLALLAHRLDRRSDLHCFLSKTAKEGDARAQTTALKRDESI